MPNDDATRAGASLNPQPWRGYFLIAAATLCWGAGATVSKAIYKGWLFAGVTPISPLVFSQTRTTFAAILLTAFLLLRNPGALRITGKDLGFSALIGTLGLAGSNFFYYWAIQKTTVAVAITVQYTAPIWVLVALAALRRQRVTLQRLLAVLLALAGVALVAGVFSPGLRLDRAGILAALLAAFSFAFYNIGGQDLVTRNPPLTVMSYALLGSALLWLVINPPWKLLASDYTGAEWWFLFGFSCLSMLLPYIFYFNGLKYLDPTRAVITSCLEPVFAALLAAVFVGEGLNPVQMLGMTAVMGATVLTQGKIAEKQSG